MGVRDSHLSRKSGGEGGHPMTPQGRNKGKSWSEAESKAEQKITVPSSAQVQDGRMGQRR